MANTKRSKKGNPANKAYLAEHRWLKNKAKKIEKHKTTHANDAQKVGTVPDYRRKKPLPYCFGAVSKKRAKEGQCIN